MKYSIDSYDPTLEQWTQKRTFDDADHAQEVAEAASMQYGMTLRVRDTTTNVVLCEFEY